jgi:hypothetical protein
MRCCAILVTFALCCSDSHGSSAGLESEIRGGDGKCDTQAGEIDDDVASLLSLSVLAMRSQKAAAREMQTTRRDEFCEQGRLLPSLYLLGAQKAATSSLSTDLMAAGVRPALQASPPNISCKFEGEFQSFWQKEFRFFDLHDVNASALRALRDEWMSNLPNCTPGSVQQVVADFSPSNLRKTPLPQGTMPAGFQYSQFVDALHNISLPNFLSQLYGQTLGSKLVFVVLLREPVARMQSAFYHAQERSFEGVCTECNASSFSKALAEALETAKGAESYIQDWMWTSMYGYSIEEWLKYFSPDQFAVIPFRKYVKNGARDVCKYVSSRLGFDISCSPHPAPHSNSHHHPHLEEDAPASLIAEARDHFTSDKKRLAEVLSDASARGAYLPGLEATASVAEVVDWLEQNW